MRPTTTRRVYLSPFLVFALYLLSLVSVAHSRGEPWKRHTIDNTSRGADGVRLLDVNGDGWMDVATGWEEGGRVRAYLNPGPERAGKPWPAVTVGSVGGPEDAVFVDLDNDGATDVVSSCEGKVKSVWVHWAPTEATRILDKSSWRTEAIPALKGLKSWMFCLPMDVDGKNGIDLVLGAKGSKGGARIGWLRSPENPRDLVDWRWIPIYQAGWIMSLVSEDMDGDGDLDVLTSDRRGGSRGVLWLENPGPGPSQSEYWEVHRVGAGDREAMFLDYDDLDGDGVEEVAVAIKDASTSILVFRRAGEEWESVALPKPSRTGTGKGVAIADIDLDGNRDLVLTCEHSEGSSGVVWLSYDATPFSSKWTTREISGETEGIKFDRIETIDLDGDGDLDVMTCEERDNLGVIWYENPTR